MWRRPTVIRYSRGSNIGESALQKMKLTSALVARAWRTAFSLRMFADLVEDRKIRVNLRGSSAAQLLEIVSELTAEYKLSLQRGLRFELNGDSFRRLDRFHVEFDRELLAQALSNVLDNAVTYSRSNSAVRIWAEHRGPGEIWLRVTNHGHKLAPEVPAHCVEKDWRGDYAHRVNPAGTGHGLWITNQVLVAHQGRFCLEDNGDEVTASLILPAEEGESDS